MTERVEFVIPGEPVTQGSVKPGQRKDGSLFTRHDNGKGVADWRKVAIPVTKLAKSRAGSYEKGVPVSVTATFYARKPKKPTYTYPVKDADKYQRALGDVLKLAGLIADDSQIVEWHVSKQYGEPRTVVQVRRALERSAA